jgi:hypothetical protein
MDHVRTKTLGSWIEEEGAKILTAPQTIAKQELIEYY